MSRLKRGPRSGWCAANWPAMASVIFIFRPLLLQSTELSRVTRAVPLRFFLLPQKGGTPQFETYVRPQIISSVLAVGTLIRLALLYGSDLEYRYEVVAILIDWTVLIVFGVLLSVFLKRAGRYGTSRLPEGSSS
jgi:hypothetical protein